jgi:hypothetical protein
MQVPGGPGLIREFEQPPHTTSSQRCVLTRESPHFGASAARTQIGTVCAPLVITLTHANNGREDPASRPKMSVLFKEASGNGTMFRCDASIACGTATIYRWFLSSFCTGRPIYADVSVTTPAWERSAANN